MPKPYYITTPIYYVNDRPHIGHVYTTTVADIVARYRRLTGQDTFFLTGTDEHAAKVIDAAAERGLSTQEWADRNAGEFESTFQRLGMTNNDFIRTSQDRHKAKVLEYVEQLMQSGDVYEGEYEGWYDAGQEEYVPENRAKDLGYKSPINGKDLVRKREKNWFFRLSAYRDPLLKLLADQEDIDDQWFDVQPAVRRNEIIARIREAEDIPISRTGQQDWGIPIPGDAEQTIYVWIDALFNYLTTVDTPDRRPFWESGPTHLIAKDILWFHAAIWPAMLLALRKRPGYEWVSLPRMVYAHSFWIAEGKKMSKSLGNFVDLEKIDDYIERFSLDALRYFLANNGPLGATDSDFAESRFIEVYNADLANTLGNCLNRVANMTNRYFDGKLPQRGPHVDDSSNYLHTADESVKRYRDAMDAIDLAAACRAAMDLVRAVNLFIDQTEPFKLAKDPSRLPDVGTILFDCAEAMRIAAVMLWPIIPAKAEEAWRRLGCGHYAASLAGGGLGDLDAWATWGLIKPGAEVSQGDPLFPRYQVKKAD